jgi:hypothetical protein
MAHNRQTIIAIRLQCASPPSAEATLEEHGRSKSKQVVAVSLSFSAFFSTPPDLPFVRGGIHLKNCLHNSQHNRFSPFRRKAGAKGELVGV